MQAAPSAIAPTLLTAASPERTGVRPAIPLVSRGIRRILRSAFAGARDGVTVRLRRALVLRWPGIAAALLLSLGWSSGAPACELRMRWAEDPPYMMAVDGSVQGLTAEVLTEALTRMGCRPIWVELPWARALRELQDGRIDVVAGALRRPEREAYAHLVDLRIESRNRLYVRADDLQRLAGVTKLADAFGSGGHLGVQIGVVYGPEFSELMQQPAFRGRLTQSGTRRSLWKMLELGRVDGVLASEFSAPWELRQLGLADRLVATPVALSPEPTFVMLARRTVTPDQAEKFRRAIAAMDRDGSLKRLTDRYGVR